MTATILVVDDDPGIRSLLLDLLNEEGYTVRLATDGLGALAQFAVELPAVVLSDLHMPRMNGWELLDAVRERALPVRVVFMSAGAQVHQEAARHGADAAFCKPFDLDQVLTVVASLAA